MIYWDVKQLWILTPSGSMNAPQALYLYSTDNSTVLTTDVSTYVQAFNASAWAYNDIKPGMIDSVEVRAMPVYVACTQASR